MRRPCFGCFCFWKAKEATIPLFGRVLLFHRQLAKNKYRGRQNPSQPSPQQVQYLFAQVPRVKSPPQKKSRVSQLGIPPKAGFHVGLPLFLDTPEGIRPSQPGNKGPKVAQTEELISKRTPCVLTSRTPTNSPRLAMRRAPRPLGSADLPPGARAPPRAPPPGRGARPSHTGVAIFANSLRCPLSSTQKAASKSHQNDWPRGWTFSSVRSKPPNGWS